ncbi:MAG: hypothetical protein R3C49_22315 [Planctomycetaceae bacterium]
MSKRELIWGLAMLLLIVIPVGVYSLLTLHPRKPEPGQRFIAEINSSTTLELKGVCYADAVSPGVRCWRANGERLADDTFAKRGSTPDGNGHTVSFVLRQQGAAENEYLPMRFHPRNCRGGHSAGISFERREGDLYSDGAVTFDAQPGFWGTTDIDVWIASQPDQLIATMKDGDAAQEVFVAGEMLKISLADSELASANVTGKPPEKDLVVRSERSLPNSYELQFRVINDITGLQARSGSRWGATGKESVNGKLVPTVRFNLGDITDCTVQLLVRHYDRTVTFSGISLSPEKYSAPRVSDVRPLEIPE